MTASKQYLWVENSGYKQVLWNIDFLVRVMRMTANCAMKWRPAYLRVWQFNLEQVFEGGMDLGPWFNNLSDLQYLTELFAVHNLLKPAHRYHLSLITAANERISYVVFPKETSLFHSLVRFINCIQVCKSYSFLSHSTKNSVLFLPSKLTTQDPQCLGKNYSHLYVYSFAIYAFVSYKRLQNV